MKKHLAFLVLVVALLATHTKAYAVQPHIVFVFDNSGSMDGNKLIEAKRALSRSIQLLPANTIVGVLIFSSSNRWIYQPGPRDLTRIQSAIDAIVIEGGTALGNALSVAAVELQRLRETYSGDKNNATFQAVALTDGENTEGRSPESVVPLYRDSQLRLDVIGIEFADDNLPRALAQNGFPNSYHTADKVDELFKVLRDVLKIETITTSADGVSDFDLLASVPTDVAKACLASIITASKVPIPIAQETAAPSDLPLGQSQSGSTSISWSKRRQTGCQAAADGRTTGIILMILGAGIFLFMVLRRPPGR